MLLAAQWHTPMVQRHVPIDKLVYRSQQWHPTCLRLEHPISESLETVVPAPPRARPHDIYANCCHQSGLRQVLPHFVFIFTISVPHSHINKAIFMSSFQLCAHACLIPRRRQLKQFYSQILMYPEKLQCS